MNRINVNFCGVEFKNPVIPASGTFGYGREYEQFYPLSKLGGISVKGTTCTAVRATPVRELRKLQAVCSILLDFKTAALTSS